jgi:tRNA dimethylallyltransferase
MQSVMSENQPAWKEMDNRPPLVVIVGPTAVGKTEMAIQIAERLGGEIVSADSRLFYRGMDIGTAKPSTAEQKRIPHHLIDVAEPDQIWSLALFQRKAREAIAEIYVRGKLPLLVGGTGQYIRAVVLGWDIPKVEPNLRLRAALEDWAAEIGGEGLYQRLTSLDPQAAAGIDARNLRRTLRALEVTLSSGRRFSDQRRSQPSPYRLLLLGLMRPRPELYQRVDARIQMMIEAGFIEEVRAFLARGYAPDLPTMSAIGYRELIAYLQGKISLDEAVRQIRRATRVFVRRQANWFKSDNPDIHWFCAGPDTLEEMLRVIQDFL